MPAQPPPMRLLILNPSQFLPWEREGINHEIRLPVLRSGAISVHRDYDYRTRAEKLGREGMVAELRAVVREFDPDAILYINTLRDWRLAPDLLAGLKGRARLLGVLPDSHNRPADGEIDFFRVFDGLVVADSIFAYVRYRLLAEHHYPGKTVLFLPGNQVLPELFHPGDRTKSHDVSHIGTVYGGRADYIAGIVAALPAGRTVSLFGGLFERTEARRAGDVVLYDYARSGAYLDVESYARIMRRSRICLSLQTDPGYLRVRGKTFEILASGAVCMFENIKEYHLTLPAEAFVAADSPADAAAKIAALLDDPADCARRAQAGFEWFRDTFDFAAFWREGFAALVEGGSPEICNPIARRAYESLRADLFAHYGGPPSEDSLLKLVFS